MGITKEELKKQLKDKEELKVVIENQYYQLIGQIQLLSQQIHTLDEKEKEQTPKAE